MNLPFAAVILFTLTIARLRSETIVIWAAQDTWLDEVSEESPGLAAGGGIQLMVGRVGDNDSTPRRRSLLQFDLQPLPPNAVITNAVLTLYAFKVKIPDMVSEISVHRVTTEWVSGSYNPGSGGHSNGMNPGDATWLHSSAPQTWQTAGGDFIGVASANQSVMDTGFYTWSGSGLTGDVQSWFNGSAGNFGWLLRGDELTPHNVKEFGSIDFFEEDYVPSLSVEYTVVPEPSALLLTALSFTAFGGRRWRKGARGFPVAGPGQA